MGNQPGESESQKETGRIEAFSDGVFAVAITLLVLSIQPPAKPLSDPDLLGWLGAQWPVYFAFVTSFATIGVMWINHHRMFTYIRKADTRLMGLNLLLLMLIAFVPFPTALVSDYIALPGQHVAALLYSGTYVLLALCFNGLWRYATHNERFLGPRVGRQEIRTITYRYSFGPPAYLLAFILAWFSAPACLALQLAMAIFYALPNN